MQKQSACIKCKNDFFIASDIVRSVKTTANDKTIIYNDIFTSLRRKKVQNPDEQLKELFGLVCYFFSLN